MTSDIAKMDRLFAKVVYLKRGLYRDITKIQKDEALESREVSIAITKIQEAIMWLDAKLLKSWICIKIKENKNEYTRINN